MGTVAIPFVLSPDGIHSFPVTYMIYHNKWGSPETWSLWVLWHSFQIYVYYVRAYSSDAWQHAFVGMWFFSDIDIVSTRRFTWPITSTQYWPGGALVTFGHTWGIGRLLAAASQRMFLKLGSYSHAGLSHSKRVQICNSVISGILCHFQCRVQAGDWLCSCWNHQRGVYSRDLQSGFIRWHCHDAPEGSPWEVWGVSHRNTIRVPGTALVIGPWPVALWWPGEGPSPAHKEDEDPFRGSRWVGRRGHRPLVAGEEHVVGLIQSQWSCRFHQLSKSSNQSDGNILHMCCDECVDLHEQTQCRTYVHMCPSHLLCKFDRVVRSASHIQRKPAPSNILQQTC